MCGSDQSISARLMTKIAGHQAILATARRRPLYLPDITLPLRRRGLRFRWKPFHGGVTDHGEAADSSGTVERGAARSTAKNTARCGTQSGAVSRARRQGPTRWTASLAGSLAIHGARGGVRASTGVSGAGVPARSADPGFVRLHGRGGPRWSWAVAARWVPRAAAAA